MISANLLLNSCQTSGFVTPPTQNLGSSLNTPHTEQDPQFSYDGRYMVFTSDRRGQRRILLYDTQQHRLLPLQGVNVPGIMQYHPDISADGRYIVYVSEQSGKPDIWVYDRHSVTPKNLTSNWLGEVRNPTISGNGRWISFESNRTGQWDIVVYDQGLNIEVSLPKPSNQDETQGMMNE
ncbi:MAG: TolB family protein [Microcystaceae cyanobacterium]